MKNLSKEETLLITEGKLVNAMLLEGLDCLRHTDIGNQGLYYQAFYSIGYGLERLLKLIIIEDYRSKNNNKLPNNGYLKKFSHNIYKMVETYTPNLLENQINKQIITFFSNFVYKSRYYNLDILTGGYNENLNPLEEWREVEDLIIKTYVKNIKQIPNKEELAKLLDETTYIYMNDMKGNKITSYTQLLGEYETIKIRQEYSVLVCFKLIQNLVKILSEIEYNYCLYPYLWEILRNFQGTYTDSEIRKKKKWRNLIT